MSKNARDLLNDVAQRFFGMDFEDLRGSQINEFPVRVTLEVLKDMPPEIRDLRLNGDTTIFSVSAIKRWKGGAEPGDSIKNYLSQSIGYENYKSYLAGLPWNEKKKRAVSDDLDNTEITLTIDGNPKDVEVVAPKNRRLKIVFLSMIFAVLAAGLWHSLLHKTTPDTQQYLADRYPNPLNMRGEDTPWVTAYELGNFVVADSVLTELEDKTDLQRFYWGLTKLYQDDFAEAINIFRTTTESELVGAQSLWFLGLCYLEEQQYDSAKEAFSLLTQEWDFKDREAQEILSAL